MIQDKKQTVSDTQCLIIVVLCLAVRAFQCAVSFYTVLNICMFMQLEDFLIYWEEEDSVNITRRDDMVDQECEPAVGDVAKVKF